MAKIRIFNTDPDPTFKWDSFINGAFLFREHSQDIEANVMGTYVMNEMNNEAADDIPHQDQNMSIRKQQSSDRAHYPIPSWQLEGWHTKATAENMGRRHKTLQHPSNQQ